ncbi:MAG: tandem-95 repeat protein [Cyanobacteria bacterium P01_H01_bin.21]
MLQDQFKDVTDSSFPKLVKRNDNPVWNEWEDTDGDGLVDRMPSYGVAWGDANGDGYVDLYLNNHFGDRNGPPPSLFINQKDGTFENRIDLFPADSRGDIVRGDRHGNIWADFDNDGDQDLIQLVGLVSDSEPSRNKFFINEINEGGGFVDKASEFGTGYAQARAREATVFDFNNDGLLDFIHGSLSDGTKSGELPATVFQQNPDGAFSDVGAAVNFEFDRSYGVEYVSLADFNGDGRLDVFQKQPNDVYDVSSGQFVKITDSLFGDVSLQNGRGLIDMAIADFNGDLKPDVFLPTSGVNGHQLVLSSPTGWEDKSLASGVRSVSYQTPDGGGVVTGDFDNDGDVDLFVLDRNGGPDFMFENQGDGTFTPTAFSETTPLQDVPRLDLRTAAVADFNNDGFLDLLETTHRNDPTYRLLENKGNNNNWLSIDLEGTVSNRDGIGATVYVTAGGVTQMRQQTGGQHHRAQDHKRIHFGLGDQNTISEVRIKWPSGIEQVINGVTVNQILQVVEAESQFKATNDSVTTSLGTAVDIQVLANDDIAPNTVFTLSANGASNGTVAVDNNGTPADGNDDFITYTPNANFVGTDSFTYKIDDNNGGTDTATVNVTIINGNLPVATNDSATVAEDTQITLDVLANDTDADSDTLSLESVLPTINGSTSIAGNRVIYTPDANFNGTDSFSYTVTDGNGGSANATVSITVTSVNDAPVANDDTLTLEQNTAAQVQVIANDTDVDGDTLTVTSVGAATDGTTSVSNNQILYTPNADFVGTDSFTYEINDGKGGTNTATVNVTVTEPGLRVEAGLLSLYTFDEGRGNTIFDVSGVGDPLNLEIDTTTGVTGGNGSQITCSCGSCQTCNSQVNWGDGVLNVYSHSLIASNQAATKLSDGIKETQEITIEAWIKSNSLNQRGPARIATLSADSGNRNFTLGQTGDDYQVRLRTTTTGNNGVGKTVTSTGAEVTTEFSHVVYSRDASGFTSLFVNNQLVSFNTIDGDFSNWNDEYQFALANELDSTRHWLGSYDLVAIYNQAFDADEVEQNYLAGASITTPPTPTNTPPVAGDDSGTVDEDAQITLNVLANDTDADNDSLSLVSVLPGSNGTTAIVGNQVLYTPNADFNGTDSFSYTVSDGNDGTDTATVNITVNPVDDAPVVTNTAPVANDDTVTTDQDTAVQVQVLTNDSDAENDGLTIVSTSDATNGTTLINNNQILYTPNTGFTGTDFFTYEINDGNGGTDTATVNVTVTQPDDSGNSGERVADGLLSLYTFDEGSGNTVFDVSGVGNPLNLQINALNGINWGDGILSLNAPNLIASNQAATKLINGITQTQALTIEAWITPDNLSQNGPARIATLSANSGTRNFTLGQQRDDYQTRLRTTTTGNNGVGKTVTSNGAEVETKLSHVVYSRDANGLAQIYVDNELVGSNTIDGDFSTWNNNYLFALGNELDGSRPWTGSYDLVAIYNQAFDASEVEQNYLAGALDDGSPAPTNTLPVAADDSGTVDEDSQITLNVLANDTDADNDGLSLVSVLPGNNGTTTIVGNQVLYTPNADFNGADSFSYTVSDGNGGTDSATVNITVTAIDDGPVVNNIVPVANNDTVTTGQNTAVQVQVLANDTDSDGDALTVISASAGSNGNTLIQNNQILYTPDADFVGTDSFTYEINDGNGGTATATVDVTVVQPGNSTGRVKAGLLSLYTFDEGSGDTVFDVSGVGNPLNLQIDTLTGVNWGDGILSVSAPNLIASNQAATKLIDGITQTQALTIEAWITPDNLTQRGPARIASLSANSGNRNVTLGQDRDDYQVRLRTTTTGNNGVGKTVSSSGAQVETDLSHVVYSRDANGLANLYVDNQLVGSNTIDGDLSTWNDQYQFALANELDGGRAWLGSYDLVAVYNQAFDASEVAQNYLAGADSSIPFGL